MEIHVIKKETYINIEVAAVYVHMMKPHTVSLEHTKHVSNVHKVKL